jgi:hypothetical protein
LLYSNTGISFSTGANVRDKDFPTGGTNAGQFAANGAFIAQASLASTSNATGSIQVVGGIGVKGNVYADAVYDGGIEIIAYANTIFLAANTADAKAVTAGSYANSAFLVANNSLGIDTTQNTNITNAGTYGNSAFAAANSASLYANSAFLKANTPTHVANSAASYANAAFSTANSAFAEADSAASYANSAFGVANTDVTNINITTGTYGNAAYYPIITVSSNGRINVVTTQVVTDPSAIAFAIALG